MTEETKESTNESGESHIIYVTEEQRLEWTTEATKLLLKYYDEKCDLLDSGIIGTQRKVWELVAKEMNKQGHYCSPQQCENKWKTLKRCYRMKKEKLERYGVLKRPFPFEEELTEIFNKRPQEAMYSPFGRTSVLSSKNVKQEQLNLMDLPGFSNTDENSQEDDQVSQVIIQDNSKLIEELSELRKTIGKYAKLTSELFKQNMDLQEKLTQYLDNAAMRDVQRLEFKETRMDQQHEVIKQMTLQNDLLKKLLDKMG